MNMEYHRQKNAELHLLEKDKECISVLMCGRFNSGKTSLLNMILGLDLPVKAVTATRAVTKISYDAVMSVDFYDGTSKRISEDELREYITVGNKDVEDGNAVTVHVPCRHLFLQRGKVEFWDTPGLEDDEELTEITMEAVKRCDIAILVMDADRFASRYEKNLLLELQEFLGGNLIVVINRMDLIGEENRDKFIKEVENLLKGLGNEYCGMGQAVFTAARQDYPDIGGLFCQIYHICTNQLIMEQCRIRAKEAKIKTTAGRWADVLEKDIYQHQQNQNKLIQKYEEEQKRLYEEMESIHRKDVKRVRDKLDERIEKIGNLAEWENALKNVTEQKRWEKNYTVSSQRVLEAEVYAVYDSLKQIVEKELDEKLYSECYPLPPEPYKIQWENIDWGVNFNLSEYKKRDTIGEKVRRFAGGLCSIIIAAVGLSLMAIGNIVGIVFIVLGIWGTLSNDGYVAGKVRNAYINQYKDDCISATLEAFHHSLDVSVKLQMREYVENILNNMQSVLERKKREALASLGPQLSEIEGLKREEEELMEYYEISKSKQNFRYI